MMEKLGRKETDGSQREMENSKYVKETKSVLKEEGLIYTREEIKKSNNGLEILGRFRMGNEARANEYWRAEENRKCRLCGEDEETLKHIFKACKITGNEEENWQQYIKGDRKSLSKLNEIIWKRRRRDEEQQETYAVAP